MAFLATPGAFTDVRAQRSQDFQFQQAQAIKQVSEVNSKIKDAFDRARELVTTAREGGATRDQLRDAILPFADAAIRTAATAQETGMQGVSDPETVASQFQAMLAGPSREEALEFEAQKEETVSAARARGTARGTPQAVSRVVQGDSPLNDRFGLGIPPGEAARVEFLQTPDGVQANVVAGFGGAGTTINVGDQQTAFSKELGKQQAEQLSAIIQTGQRANATEQDLKQMAALLNAGTETGTLQPLLSGLQGLAADLGVDVEGAAQKAGIDIGDLANKQEFDRLAKRVIIDGFEKFKGNLNQREVELAENAFANLGRDEEANKFAIASLIASQRIAKQRAIDATLITSSKEFRALVREQLTGESAAFEKERKKALEELGIEIPEGAPPGTRRIGETKDGLPLYQTPSGEFLVEE